MISDNNRAYRGYRSRRITRFAQRAAGLFVTGMGLLLSTPAAHAQTTSLLTNGNFESGNFNGWTVVNERPTVTENGVSNSSGNFFISKPGERTPAVTGYTTAPDGTPTPYNYTFATANNALPGNGGSYYAVTSSDVPGRSGIIQAFTTPTITAGQGFRLTLTFDWFVNDQSTNSTIKDSSDSLDYTTGGTYRSNQYARVDILRFASANYSTSTNDVLQYIDIDSDVPTNSAPNTTPNPYQRKTVQLTGLQAGTQYKIRFAEVDNIGALNFGVDNIGIQAEITPEPSTLALALPFFGIAPLCLSHARRRRNHKNRRNATR